MPSLAFLFPGQGAQAVGMAKDLCTQLPAAMDLFDRASAVLGYDLFSLCAFGPEEKLTATDVSQPAIFVASLAALEKLKAEKPAVVEEFPHRRPEPGGIHGTRVCRSILLRGWRTAGAKAWSSHAGRCGGHSQLDGQHSSH